MLAAFEGWNDAGQSATDVIRHLVATYESTEVRHIRCDGFYDYQVARPITCSIQGRRRILWPQTTFYDIAVSPPCTSSPRSPRNRTTGGESTVIRACTSPRSSRSIGSSPWAPCSRTVPTPVRCRSMFPITDANAGWIANTTARSASPPSWTPWPARRIRHHDDVGVHPAVSRVR